MVRALKVPAPLVWAAMACVCAGAPARGALRQIETEPSSLVDPVTITEVTVGNMQVQCGLLRAQPARGRDLTVPFEWGENWLQHVEIYLFNRTNKTIVAGRITLTFPETKVGTTVSVFPIDFGVIPANDFLSNGQPFPHRANEIPVSWGPGRSMILHLADYADRIKVALSQEMPDRAPSRIFVIRTHFFFSDGMQWYVGRFFTPDPQQPGKVTYLDPNYFPGDSDDNWPVPGQRFSLR